MKKEFNIYRKEVRDMANQAIKEVKEKWNKKEFKKSHIKGMITDGEGGHFPKKEFIKLLKEELGTIQKSDWCRVGTKDQQEGRKGALGRAINEINKLAGDDLK